MIIRRPIVDGEEDFLRANLWTLGAHECARRLNRSASTVYGLAKRLGLKHDIRHKCNTFDVSHFTNPIDPFVVYFLGFFWADGTVREAKSRMVFKIKKVDFEDLRPNLSRLGEGWIYREPKISNPKWSPLSILEITHRDFAAFLIHHDYGVKSKASADSILSVIPRELRHYWWRGYFDGDGSVSKLKTGAITFNSGLDQDWTFVQKLGTELNIDFDIGRTDRGNRGGSKAGIANYAYMSRLISYMYAGEVFGLQRKRHRCEEYMKSDKRKKRNLTSAFRGVSLDKYTNRFVMQITSNGIHHSKRCYSETEAAHLYDTYAKQMFGNRAVLNFPA